jgi:hypothetical protein
LLADDCFEIPRDRSLPNRSTSERRRGNVSFRRDSKTEHAEERTWENWLKRHADLILQCGLPPRVFRSRRDWEYLLRYGYWCENDYGSHIGKIDFDLDELDAAQTSALRRLLELTLSDEQKQRGCAAWHFVHPIG